MSQMRRRYRVAWDDRPAVEIRTNAWDMTVAQDYAGDPTRQTFALIRNALVRADHDPPPLEQFIELLDELEDLSPEPEPVNGAAVDPTQLVHGEHVPSRLPS